MIVDDALMTLINITDMSTPIVSLSGWDESKADRVVLVVDIAPSLLDFRNPEYPL